MVSSSPAPALRCRPAPYKVLARLDQPLRGFGRTFEERVNPGPSAVPPVLALEPLEPVFFAEAASDAADLSSEEEDVNETVCRRAPSGISARLDQPLRGFGRTFKERVTQPAAPFLLALKPLEPVFFADADWNGFNIKSEEESIHTPIFPISSRLDQPLRGFGRTFEERVNPSATPPLLALEPLEPIAFAADWDVSNVKSEEEPESIHTPIFPISSRLDQPLRGFGRTFEERVLPSAAPPLLALEPLEPVFFVDADWDVTDLKSEEGSIHTPIFPNTSRLDQPLRGFGRTFEERVNPSPARVPVQSSSMDTEADPAHNVWVANEAERASPRALRSATRLSSLRRARKRAARAEYTFYGEGRFHTP